MVKVVLAQKIMKANKDMADCNRRLLKEKNIVMVNLISGPGAGKTTLLEKSLPLINDRYSAAVIEGDIYTTYDADRIARTGVDVVQINTHGACHLDAQMIAEGLKQLTLDKLNVIFIENVGNLVCPSGFDLGEDLKIVFASVAEGMDKPAKYPLAFRQAAAAVITKTDLLPFTDFNTESYLEELYKINSNLKTVLVSAKNGGGLEKWCSLICEIIRKKH